MLITVGKIFADFPVIKQRVEMGISLDEDRNGNEAEGEESVD